MWLVVSTQSSPAIASPHSFQMSYYQPLTLSDQHRHPSPQKEHKHELRKAKLSRKGGVSAVPLAFTEACLGRWERLLHPPSLEVHFKMQLR